jgi:hypothetical protein
MRCEHITAGAISCCEVRHASGTPLPDHVKAGREIDLFWSPEAKTVYGRCEGDQSNIPLVGRTDHTTRELGELLARNLPRLVFVDFVQKDKSAAQIQIHSFPKLVELPALDLCVDEKCVSLVNKAYLKHRARSSDEVAKWLEDRCLIVDRPLAEDTPSQAMPKNPGKACRLVLSTDVKASGDLTEAIVIYGDSIRVDVKNVDGHLRVIRVRRSKAQNDRIPIMLGHGIVRFVDSTAEAEARRVVVGALSAVTSSGHAFIDLWRSYCKMEEAQANEAFQNVGQLRYSSWDPGGDDRSVRFRLVIDQNTRESLNALAGMKSDITIEAATEAPLDILTDGITAEEMDAAEGFGGTDKSKGSKTNDRIRPFCGDITTIRDSSIDVQAIGDQESDLPPQTGVLYVSRRSHKKQQERREKAYDLILNGKCAMPQLGLLVEDLDAPVARVSQHEPVTPIVKRKVFPNHPPTRRQEDAIRIALNTPDIAVIQGPPGTGKTTVINAILERLNEIDSDAPDCGGTYLLTSFQHDAVENAISRTRVNGLPAVKFGRRSRKGGRDDRGDDEIALEKWRLEQISKLRAKANRASATAGERELKLLRDDYALRATARENTSAIIVKAVALVEGIVSRRDLETLRSLKDEFSEGLTQSKVTGGESFVRAVRALRHTEAAFRDDGSIVATYLLEHCSKIPNGNNILNGDERALLDRAASWMDQTSPPFLRDLESLRRRLLRVHYGNKAARSSKPDERVVYALDALLLALRNALDQGVDARQRIIARFAEDLDADVSGVHRAVSNYTRIYAATCQQSVSFGIIAAKGGEDGEVSYDTVIIDEAARANPLDLFIPMAMAKKRLILVGDHRQLPQMVDPLIEKAVLEGRSGDDEEANAREGHQSNDHAGGSRLDLRVSLFERLFATLTKREDKDRIPRCVTLNEQYRMHPVLGELVNKCFYERHSAGERFDSPMLPDKFRHGLSAYAAGTQGESSAEFAAAWKCIPRDSGTEQRVGTSFVRAKEAAWIAEELDRLLRTEAGEQLSFGVISFYAPQVEEIVRALASKGIYELVGSAYQLREDYRLLTRADGTVEERLRVGSVDAFQGKEFDVVFLSTVRSNDRANYGHLAIPNRLCVSMSRQRKLLIVVGDEGMLEGKAALAAVGPLVEFYGICKAGKDGIIR